MVRQDAGTPHHPLWVIRRAVITHNG